MGLLLCLQLATSTKYASHCKCNPILHKKMYCITLKKPKKIKTKKTPTNNNNNKTQPVNYYH